MSIVRLAPRRQFAVIPNALLNDKKLSWEARGLLAYLLSKPDNWSITRESLLNEGPAGKDKLDRMLHELEAGGYFVRQQNRDENGQFVWEQFVYDEPQAGNPSPVSPVPENPALGNSALVNPAISYKTVEDKTDPDQKTVEDKTVRDGEAPPQKATAWKLGFYLNAKMREFAEQRGVDPWNEFDKWRDYCAAHRPKYIDWEAAWRGWVRNVDRFSPPAKANGHKTPMDIVKERIAKAMEEEKRDKAGS